MSSIRNKPKVGVIIGSGSVKSTAAIGLFQVLAREGIDVDMIVGTSGGAVVGASIALGPSLKDASHRIHNNWTKEVMTEFDYRAILQITMSRIFEFTSDFSIFGDTRIMENLRSHFGDLTFADLSLPLYMVATDATSGKPVVLSEGDIVNSIRASMGIPIIFGATEIDGQWLLDGGISNPLPVDVAIKEHCDIIIAIGFHSPVLQKASNFQQHISHILTIMENNLTRSQFAFQNIAHHAELIPMLMSFDFPVGIFDTELIPQIIDAGRVEAEKHVPYVKRVMEQWRS